MSWRDRYESPFSLESPFLEEASTILDSGPVEERDTPPPGGPLAGVAFPSGEKLPVTTGATLAGEMECPVHGADGNREFLLGLHRKE